MIKSVLLFALFGLTLAMEIPFEVCEGRPAPISVSIPECVTSCDLGLNDKFHLNFDFVTTGRVEELRTTATIVHNGTTIDYPLPTGDACNAVIGGCPLEAGQHTVSFPVILEDVPTGNSLVIMDIVDENGYSVVCGQVHAIINP